MDGYDLTSLHSSVQSHRIDVQRRQGETVYVDFSSNVRDFNSSDIEFKAIDVMKELGDSNLAEMVFLSIKQNVTTKYTAR